MLTVVLPSATRNSITAFCFRRTSDGVATVQEAQLNIYPYTYPKKHDLTAEPHDNMCLNIHTKLQQILSKNAPPVTKIALLFDSPSHLNTHCRSGDINTKVGAHIYTPTV